VPDTVPDAAHEDAMPNVDAPAMIG
jgi:hypothetical protein